MTGEAELQKDVKRLKRPTAAGTPQHILPYLTISYRESVLGWSGHILDFGVQIAMGGIEVSVRTLGDSSSLPCSSSVKQCMH